MSPQPFPHLKPKEGLIWAAFLLRYGTQWDRFDYDVHVGEGHPIDPSWPDYIKVMVRKISPQRIDAVGWKEGHPTIFEVTPKAGGGTWGHLFLYRYLFIQQFPQAPAPALAYVTPVIQPDQRRYLESEGVRLFIVQPITGP